MPSMKQNNSMELSGPSFNGIYYKNAPQTPQTPSPEFPCVCSRIFYSELTFVRMFSFLCQYKKLARCDFWLLTSDSNALPRGSLWNQKSGPVGSLQKIRGNPGKKLEKSGFGVRRVWKAFFIVNCKKRVAQKLHGIILLPFILGTFRFNFEKNWKVCSFINFG